ncbi:MAG: magnesium transporter CorA family protein [Cellulomonas sp.]|jgi:magnesium transporter|nr:magnesium transporter CorA family protein [Cellulomonas sp.]
MTDTTGVVRTRRWEAGQIVAEGFDLAEVSDHLADPAALVWVDLLDPDHGLLERLADEIGLSDQAVEDVVEFWERPKVTRSPGHLLFVVYATRLGTSTATASASRLRLAKISAFLLPRGLITVRASDAFDMDEVVRRWDADPELLTAGPAALLYCLLDTVVDGHFETVQQIDDAVEALEDGLFDGEPLARPTQEKSFQVRRELVELRRVVLPMSEVVGVMQRYRADWRLRGRHADHTGQHPTDADERSEHVLDELDGWFADLHDHVLRVGEWTESLRDLVATVFETNLALADARLNAIMKKLTGWAAIIAVPTAITGWYGQNVPYPGFGKPLGLWLAAGAILAASGTLYVVFRRKDWI